MNRNYKKYEIFRCIFYGYELSDGVRKMWLKKCIVGVFMFVSNNLVMIIQKIIMKRGNFILCVV